MFIITKKYRETQKKKKKITSKNKYINLKDSGRHDI